MKIIAIGKNYAAHALEFDGSEKRGEVPLLFFKPDSSILKNGKPFFLPDFMGRIDYEAEIVVRINKLGKGIPTRFASRYYDAFTVGIDFTARDMQHLLMEQGATWDLAKGFDGAATLGNFCPSAQYEVDNLSLRLDVNGKTVQRGNSGEMLFSIDETIAYVSRFCTLKTGDLLFTGTPAGVGEVHVGDHLQGYLNDQKVLDFYVR